MAGEAPRRKLWRARLIVAVLALLAIAAVVWWVSRVDVISTPDPPPSEDCADSTVALARHAHLGRVAAVREAIADGADVDERDEHGNTPLACVHPRGDVEIVAALLDAGANPDVEDRFGDTVVADAVRFCHDDVLELLLDAGADPDAGGKGGSPLSQAVEGGRPSAVEILLASDGSPDLDPDPVVSLGSGGESESTCPEATDAAQAEAVTAALEAGGDADAALAWAAHLRVWDVVPAALAAGADPDADQGIDLSDISCSPDEPGVITPESCSVIPGLASLAGRPNDALDAIATTEGEPPVEIAPVTVLVRAAWAGETAAVRALLDAGAEPNLVGPSGVTALAAAAGAGEDEIVDLLLPVVAVPLPEDAILPSHVADAAGHTALADRLLAAGA